MENFIFCAVIIMFVSPDKLNPTDFSNCLKKQHLFNTESQNFKEQGNPSIRKTKFKK